MTSRLSSSPFLLLFKNDTPRFVQVGSHASVSDYKYKSLMRLLDVAIPSFDDDDDKAKEPTSSSSETTKTLSRNSLTDKDITGRPRSKS
jgi:hypothetical protein